MRFARVALLVIGLVSLRGRPARANGAFPAPFRVFAPADRPADLTVATNFGFIMTRDGGATWFWTCEHADGLAGYLYQQARTGDVQHPGRILGLSDGNLILTDDDACSWTRAMGFPTTEYVDDSFIDPSDAQHVVAITHHGLADSGVFGLFASHDGGTTFDATPLLVTPAGTRLDSVEIAAATPGRWFATTSSLLVGGGASHVLRSDDAGATFATLDLPAELAADQVRIAAIDPVDPDVVYLRATDAANATHDRLVISRDAGASFTVALSAPAMQSLSAFLRRADGTLLAAAFGGDGGGVYRSTDAGASFALIADGLRVGSFAERDGALYVLANGVTDPYLVGISRDGGDTIEPMLHLGDVTGVQTCTPDLRKECIPTCANLINPALFAAAVCETLVETPRSREADAGVDAAVDAGVDAVADGATNGEAGGSSGCGCGVGFAADHDRGHPHHSEGPGAPTLVALAALAAAVVGCRRARGERSGQSRGAAGAPRTTPPA